ncbi:hypothetical protein VTO42DRAFT_480 [Malbranchea cinnamomea]
MSESLSYLAYHEPPIATILNQSGFLIALNLINGILDRLVHCGLIGQLLVGIVWGMPGAKWLDENIQSAIQQLGYLGLIALVYEGGLSVSFSSLRANLLLSIAVALTGIAVPIGLSFVLVTLLSATPLQAFAAGAALSATSLGTTFTILSTTGLIKTRLGVVTTSAAMLDDVVGLVMVQVITNLGNASEHTSFDAVTVVRPIVVSIGIAVALVLACRFVFGPLLKKIIANKKRVPAFIGTFGFAALAHTCILFGLVAGGTYAGASSLFAAYLAGAIITWFDDVTGISGARNAAGVQDTDSPSSQAEPDGLETGGGSSSVSLPTGEQVYERYYKGPVNSILKPLFFASIGFAIPITEMFHGEVVWRGIVYAVLMAFGKLVTGLWLCRVSFSPIPILLSKLKSMLIHKLSFCALSRKNKDIGTEKQHKGHNTNNRTSTQNDQRPMGPQKASSNSQGTAPEGAYPPSSALPPKPISLYPSSILGLSMVARGEIGYLIASLAETGGVFSRNPSGDDAGKSSQIYLVVVWAITLCTLFGPISVGTMVNRVKKLQKQRRGSGGPDPLGIWGI